MLNVAKKNKAGEAWLGFGEIEEAEAEGLMVITNFGRVTAKRAEGCLVAPKAGDRVLLASCAEEAFVLTVLQRQNPAAPLPIEAESGADFKLGGGLALMIKNMSLHSLETAEIKTNLFNLTCLKGGIKFGEFSFGGGILSTQAEKIKVAAKSLTTSADKVWDRFKRHYRRVREFEDARVGRLSLRVKSLFHLGSQTATLKAKDRFKIDSDKILLG